jgi:hypothetical protein
MTKENLGTSRSVTLRARFQFGTRGAECATNRRELDDEGLVKTPNLQALGQPQIMFCLKLILFRVRKMIKVESTRLSRVSQSLTL